MTVYLISPHPQGTAEWKAARAGKATASKAKEILAKGKSGGEAYTRRDYRFQLVTERLIGSPQDDTFVNDAMRWGTENEPFARMAYEAATGNLVEEVGFAYLPHVAAGVSVDGFVEERRGFTEYKCPKSATHIAYLQAARLPPEYVPQVTHGFWITGCEFCDFASYDPRLPEALQFFHVRVERNEVDVAGYEIEVRKFLSEVDALEAQLRGRMLKRAA